VLIGGIVLGLVLGVVAGGSLANLATIRLRRTWLLLAAVVIRYGTEALLNADIPIVADLRLPLLASAFAFLLVALWTNRTYPGLSLAFVGILSNATVIVANGGYMPIWEPALITAGFQPGDIVSTIHTILPPTLDASFLLHLGPLADVIPIPLPIIRHHHEWYNGSGYPDRLIGDEIPKLARVLHVADAFEAMTAARPYRMTPLSHEQALAELRKFAGVQFDPVVVDAFVQTHHVEGVPDAGRPAEPRQIPLLQQAAERMTAARNELPTSAASTASAPADPR
jgi:hypothetical protein